MGPEILRIEVEAEASRSTGLTPSGEWRLIPFSGGRFEGPELQGRLLPGGSDWQQVRTDGVLEIQARYLLETDAGEVIEVLSEGLRAAAPDVLARLAQGEEVPAEEYYFRTFIRLRTASPRLTDLNRRLFYGTGIRRAHTVEITVYGIP